MLTQKRLKEVLHYDPKTGIFTWKIYKSNKAYCGDVAGYTAPDGYILIRIDKTLYRAHRLAFLYMEGYFPEHTVDHKNGITGDNWWNNLRHVTRACNLQNCKISSINTSGFPGVCWWERDKNWKAYIQINRKTVNICYQPTALDAALARLTFEVQCPQWKCNHRSELVKAIKKAWPEFNERSLG